MKSKLIKYQRIYIRLLAVLALMVLFLNNAFAADFFVNNISEFNSAVSSVSAGDTITMADGTWSNVELEFKGIGNSSNEITLRAETPGQVILNGSSTLNISGAYMVVDGLRFEGGALSDGSNAIVEFRGDFGNATNSRFTNSAILGYNPSDINDRYHWVEIFGTNNRVDNNRFEDHNHSGVTVVVRRDAPTSDLHLIDNNHFVDRPEGNGNGWETIRVGTSSQSLSDSYTTVENNLFERVDGEIEIISNKSGNNTYRYNTFRESEGTLTLRHGNDNTIQGNFFLGDNTNQSGAIRVIGERQTIVNNYIANVDDRAGAAISISAGVPNSALNQYYQVKDATIAHNTIVNTLGNMLTFDDGLGSSGRTLLAEDVTIANNIFRSNGPTIFEGNEGSGWTWEGNIAFGGSLGPKSGDSGITVVDPQLQQDADGIWHLSSTSPAINASVGNYSSLITDDMDGQPRIGIYDVGADEYSVATIVRKPLSAEDVGPSWLQPGVDPPSGGGCFANGCAIQAEDYTSILDPDNDGIQWSVDSVASALGGEVLTAPNGARTNIPPDTHETIATYDLTFQQAGTYRAYYRARGFDGSTDSIYVPDDFATDPDNQETLSSDGTFQWELGQLFTITASEVGVPLEFRIGRREEMAEFDALVLDLDHSLTSTELDDLFAAIPEDLNQDGFVDSLDLGILLGNWGQSVTPSEGELNGIAPVEGLDLGILLAAWSPPPALASATVPEPSSFALILLALLCATSRRNQTTSKFA